MILPPNDGAYNLDRHQQHFREYAPNSQPEREYLDVGLLGHVLIVGKARRLMLTYTVAPQGEEGQAGPEGVCSGGVGTVQEAVHEQIARPTDAL